MSLAVAKRTYKTRINDAPLTGGERVPVSAIQHYAELARQAEKGKTVNVTRMSKEEMLKLIRR